MAENLLQILLVEDDEVDAEYMLRSLQHYKEQLSVTVAQNGLEALAILRGTGNSSRHSVPWLILTDLNMPQMNSLEFLQALRCDPALRRLVVYMLTSSNLNVDKSAAYAYQVAGYILKENLDSHLPHLLSLLHYYYSINEFPPSFA